MASEEMENIKDQFADAVRKKRDELNERLDGKKLSVDQFKFLTAVKQGKNVFLTGKAGTGKSFAVEEAIFRLKEAGKNVAATALTGVAANNINGATLHSTFGLSIHGVLTYDECRWLKDYKREAMAAIDVLIVDEISMLRPDILDAVHWTLKKNGCGALTDRQVIFVGDLKQLEAPIDENTMAVLLEKYPNYTFDKATIYKKLDPVTIELEEVHRQDDQEFIENLNIVRDGGKSPYFKQFVHDEPKGVLLAPHNATVQAYNEEGLALMEGKQHIFNATIEGNAKGSDFNIVETIVLKDGCKIMYLANEKNSPLVNGTLGIFRMEDELPMIQVGETKFLIKEKEFEKSEYVYNAATDSLDLRTVGTITQIPIKLAYALTIHKSQGLTFEEVTVDLRRPCFAAGQLYTALSRVKRPEGLRLIVPKRTE